MKKPTYLFTTLAGTFSIMAAFGFASMAGNSAQPLQLAQDNTFKPSAPVEKGVEVALDGSELIGLIYDPTGGSTGDGGGDDNPHICENGLDDDGDGLIDFKEDGTGDPGCESAADNTEEDDQGGDGGVGGGIDRSYLNISIDAGMRKHFKAGSKNQELGNLTFSGKRDHVEIKEMSFVLFAYNHSTEDGPYRDGPYLSAMSPRRMDGLFSNIKIQPQDKGNKVAKLNYNGPLVVNGEEVRNSAWFTLKNYSMKHHKPDSSSSYISNFRIVGDIARDALDGMSFQMLTCPVSTFNEETAGCHVGKGSNHLDDNFVLKDEKYYMSATYDDGEYVTYESDWANYNGTAKHSIGDPQWYHVYQTANSKQKDEVLYGQKNVGLFNFTAFTRQHFRQLNKLSFAAAEGNLDDFENFDLVQKKSDGSTEVKIKNVQPVDGVITFENHYEDPNGGSRAYLDHLYPHELSEYYIQADVVDEPLSKSFKLRFADQELPDKYINVTTSNPGYLYRFYDKFICTNFDCDDEIFHVVHNKKYATAFTIKPATHCNDGIDNDNDGAVDFPADIGCENAEDNDESDGGSTGDGGDDNPHICENGVDDDGDGLIDYPADPGCESADDNDEEDDQGGNGGVDGSAAGPGAFTCDSHQADFPNSNGFITFTWDKLSNAEGVKVFLFKDQGSEGDQITSLGNHATSYTSLYRMPAGTHDVHIVAYNDYGTFTCVITFTVDMCSDGVDNDGDGLVDFPADPGCSNEEDNDEYNRGTGGTVTTECNDGIDNDWDGRIDYPEETGCESAVDKFERKYNRCSDGIDNDFPPDGLIDYPTDPGCVSDKDVNEWN
jgi:hypothetical protein